MAVRIIELSIVLVAAAGVALWRSVAMYRQTFGRKNL